MAFPLFLVLEALSKQNDLKRHKHGMTCSLDSGLFHERLCLPGLLFTSWLILQLTSFPCPLSAGSLGTSGQVGPSLTPTASQVHPRHGTPPSDCVGYMRFYTSGHCARDCVITPVCPSHTSAFLLLDMQKIQTTCWVNEYTVGCSSSPHFATVYHRGLKGLFSALEATSVSSTMELPGCSKNKVTDSLPWLWISPILVFSL